MSPKRSNSQKLIANLREKERENDPRRYVKFVSAGTVLCLAITFAFETTLVDSQPECAREQGTT